MMEYITESVIENLLKLIIVTSALISALTFHVIVYVENVIYMLIDKQLVQHFIIK